MPLQLLPHRRQWRPTPSPLLNRRIPFLELLSSLLPLPADIHLPIPLSPSVRLGAHPEPHKRHSVSQCVAPFLQLEPVRIRARGASSRSRSSHHPPDPLASPPLGGEDACAGANLAQCLVHAWHAFCRCRRGLGLARAGHVPPRLLSSPPPPPFATSGDLILPTLLSSAGQCQASSQACSADLESLERLAGGRTSSVVIVAPSFSTPLPSRLSCEFTSPRALVFLAVRSVFECEDAGGQGR